jgi:riboflavin biosynthesis pyrimidine reductase
MDVTVDGRIILGRQRAEDDPQWLAVAGEIQPALHRRIRGMIPHQAILCGSETILRERGGEPRVAAWPAATGETLALYEDYLPREILDRPKAAWFTVVDSRGRIKWAYKESKERHLLVLAARHTSSGYLEFLRQNRIPYLIVGDQRVDLHEALERLADRLNVTCVLAEGGGHLNGALLRARLIDEVNLIVMPALVGGNETPTAFEAPEFLPEEEPVRLKLLSAETADGFVWLRYGVLN